MCANPEETEDLLKKSLMEKFIFCAVVSKSLSNRSFSYWYKHIIFKLQAFTLMFY